MDSDQKTDSATTLTDRIRKSWMPLAAVGGALASFVAAAFRTRPEPKESMKPSGTALASAPQEIPKVQVEPDEALKRRYVQTGVIGAKNSAHPFRKSLVDVAVDARDTIFCLGDDEIRTFTPQGEYLSSWKIRSGSACVGIGSDGRIYTGSLGRVDIYTPTGQSSGSIVVEESNKPAAVTAIKFMDNEILIADATARLIHRYDTSGNRIGTIGDEIKTGSFMLPNKWLDMAVSPDGILYATDTGRHRITGWLLDGSLVDSFGKFGMQNPSDFVGCCNPVNIAVTPENNLVTAEKMIARVKVFDPQGALIAYIGPEYFHPQCTHIHLAVDSEGRILAADPLHLEIKIFSPSAEA